MNPQHRIYPVAKRLLQLSLLGLSIIFLTKAVLVPSIAQSNERELEDTVPKHLPVRVKIRKEKEKAFKDLKNEKWLRDFEIELTNIGDKPIYFLSLLLILPELKSPAGYPIGFPLRYGRIELVDFKTPPQPEDIPIKPGETYMLKIPQRDAKGWENLKSKEKKLDPKKVQLKFQLLNFGNGTGFMRTDGAPIPNLPNKKAAICFPDEREIS